MKLCAIPNVRAGSDIDRWDRGTARMVVRDIKHTYAAESRFLDVLLILLI